MIKKISFILFAIFILSCSPPVVFDGPYPQGGSDLLHLPDVYQGTFICESDSSIVLIGPQMITLRQEHFFTTALKDVDEKEDCSVIGNEMYIKGREECVPLEFVNDSTVRGIITEYDTLFVISKTGIARTYKGHLVLSQEIEDSEWAINIVTLQDNRDMIYRAITDETKIKNVRKITQLQDITDPEDDSPRYKIRPTMKEFDALLSDEKVFVECEYLTRVSLENRIIHLD